MWTLEFKCKILGKILAYIGFLVAMAGLINNWNALLFILGVLINIIGCILHEANEQ